MGSGSMGEGGGKDTRGVSDRISVNYYELVILVAMKLLILSTIITVDSSSAASWLGCPYGIIIVIVIDYVNAMFLPPPSPTSPSSTYSFFK